MKQRRTHDPWTIARLGRMPELRPPFPTPLPLWYALLLRRQKRCNILPPPWLAPGALQSILEFELDHAGEAFSPGPKMGPATTTSPSDSRGSNAISSQAAALNGEFYLDGRGIEPSPPFLPSATQDSQPNALPYHWMEMAHLLLSHAGEDFEDADTVRRLIRDLREVRMAKLRKGIGVLDAGAGVQMNGVGAMEVAESRGLVGQVIDGLRKLNASREQAQREREDEGGGDLGGDEDDEDDI